MAKLIADPCHSAFDPNASIPQLFSGQVQACPAATAILNDGASVSYAQLADYVARIARQLCDAGVQRGDRVGILGHRSVWMVAGQLAVMTVGAAFVPLDPSMPEEHRRDIVTEAGIETLLVARGALNESRPFERAGGQIIVLEADDVTATAGRGVEIIAEFLEDSQTCVSGGDAAYVIYTSGSTGRPKGVMVAHRGVCRLVRGQSYADLGPDQVMLCMAAIGFDAIIGEIYSAVLNGGTLAILPDPAPSLDRIAQVIARDGVTIAYITAGLFHIIAVHRPEILAPLQQVFPCGDVLSEVHVARLRRILPHLRMINGYGPTENTVFTCCYPIGDDWTGGPIPIGRGVAHDKLFVLDETLTPVPQGEVGQLAVGGHGLAIGYLGRPDLTAASFVSLRTSGFDGRIYLTGDLVRMQPDGVVQFHGRADRQVKVNGQRVELDAVEHALRATEGVGDAAVVATRRVDGTCLIVGFATTTRPETTSRALMDKLRGVMPAAAVPARIELREGLPLNSSGKVDRKALAQTLIGTAPSDRPAAKALSLRDTIRETWSDVLGTPIADDERTFFDHGGTSLQLIAVHERLQTRLGQRFDIARLFEAPRLKALERLLDPSSNSPTTDLVAARRASMARARKRKANVS